MCIVWNFEGVRAASVSEPPALAGGGGGAREEG